MGWGGGGLAVSLRVCEGWGVCMCAGYHGLQLTAIIANSHKRLSRKTSHVDLLPTLSHLVRAAPILDVVHSGAVG